MTETVRFGLTLGSNLTDHDKQVIDAILAAYEVHDHRNGANSRLTDPTAVPTATLDSTQGALLGGTTYYYRVAYRDQFGLETAASGEVSVTTPSAIAPPSAPAVTTVTGGTLGAGPTYYALSAVTANGETPLSTPTLISISDFNTVDVEGTNPFPDPAITSYNVWRQGPRASGFTKIGSITNPAVAFVDDGSVPDDQCACDPANLPPSVNLTSSTNQATLTLATADQPLFAAGALGHSWVVYRSTTSGVYPANSLVAQVTADDGMGGIVTSYIDDGLTQPSAGQPLDNSQTLTPSRPLAVTKSVSANTTASIGDIVLADATTSALTITLPGAVNGAVVNVKKVDGSVHAVTIAPPTGTIDGQATFVISQPYESIECVSDGTNWFII